MKPGLHPGVSFSDYHAVCAVNHSKLRLFARTAAHAREEIMHPREQTPEMHFGQAFHTAVLEPERFATDYTVPPQCDRRTKEGKSTWAAFEAAGYGLLIKQGEQDACRGMAESCHAHPIIGPMLSAKGMRETVAVWDRGGVACKARIDALVAWSGWTVVLDLKSTRDASGDAFARACANYGYHSQAAWYLDGLDALAPMQRRFLIAAVEKVRPFAVALYEFDAMSIEQGRVENERHFGLLRDAESSGVWPGYGPAITPLSLPKWAIRTAEWEASDVSE